jgi:hypothetical protein
MSIDVTIAISLIDLDLGEVMVGFAYLALSFTGLMFPADEHKIWNFAQPVLFGEVAIMLWLTIIGAKEPRLAAGS